ncbi:MAG TPA: hypothetical protein VGS80_10875, partial [Ktedonobacterales bacterium]|nr:hypothetical protein [Ktedonobacterales bacterium]
RGQVLEVGVDTITAARVKNGKVVKVLVDPRTVLEHSDDGDKGDERHLWGTLSAISPGAIFEVKGYKDHQRGTLRQERVTLCDQPGT